MDINTLFTENKTTIMIVGGIVLLYIIYILLKKYVFLRDETSIVDTILVPDGMDVSKDNTDDILKNNTISKLDNETGKSLEKSFQLTTFVYLYLYSFDTNLGQVKNIIYKPHNDGSINFQWYISPNKNDVVFEIKLSNGLNGKITIPNIQLRRWISVACIVDGNQANFYKDGKYYRSVVLNGIPVFTNSPILLGKGFNNFSGILTYTGYLASFYHSYRAEEESFIENLHKSARPADPVTEPDSDKCITTLPQMPTATKQ
jgi:hypothetical protein